MRNLMLASVVSLPVIWGCVNGTDGTARVVPTDSVAPPQQTGLKPPSELALLMRDMAAFSDSTQARLKRGAGLLPYPASFKLMHTAKPTDGVMEMDLATYTAFVDHYLQQIDALYAAAPADRDRAFNGTLTGCTNCHTVVCPGPMTRIKRMYVPVQ